SVVAFLVPARSHFADGPFVFSPWLHVAGIAMLAFAVLHVVRRRGAPSPAGAAVAALAPLLLIGVAGGAPMQDGYVYLALPLLAAAVAIGLEDAASRGG